MPFAPATTCPPPTACSGRGPSQNLNPHAPTKVNFANDGRAPLLLMAFGRDHIIPPKVARHNAAKYGKSSAITAYKEFPDRPHFPGVPGWEEVADYALAWALNPTTTDAVQRTLAPA
jgi:pimeloyl-ACP methyl ester carboxylesterase